MIIATMSKLMLCGLLYFAYQVYKSASGGILEILGDLPKVLAHMAMVVAAALMCAVALLWYSPSFFFFSYITGSLR